MGILPESERIKTVSNVFVIDRRNDGYKIGIAEHIERVKLSELGEHVPDEIRIQFNIANNILVYAFFCYRLGMAAQLQAFTILESSMLFRIKQLSIFVRDKASFSEIFQIILDKNLLDDSALNLSEEQMARFPEENDRWCKSLKNYWAPSTKERMMNNEYAGRRNELIHSPGSLESVWQCVENVAKCASIINHIYK